MGPIFDCRPLQEVMVLIIASHRADHVCALVRVAARIQNNSTKFY